MDAPVYPPAAVFEQPVRQPLEELNAENVSLGELRSSPQAWAIVTKYAPNAGRLGGGGGGMGDNMTVDAFVGFGEVSPEAYAAINAELSKLPRSQWPAP